MVYPCAPTSRRAICFLMLAAHVAVFGATRARAEEPGADAAAARPAVERRTLAEVVARVLAKNPEVEFYSAEIAAAKGGATTAAAWANPQLSTTVGDKRTVGTDITGEGLAWSVAVRQTFEWPGRIPLRKAIANQQIKLAELGFDQFKAALTARTRSVVFAMFAAQEKAAAARAVADRIHALREVLVQRDLAGITPELELRIIEATEITMLRKASEASISAQGAALELNQLIGEPWQADVEIAPIDLAFSPAPDSSVLLAATRENNFQIRMRQVELEQQGLKVSLARNDRYPAVSVGPYFSKERSGDREQHVGVGIEVPLPLWNRNEGDIEAAAAREKQAETSMYVTQRTVERQVVEAALAYRARLVEMSKWRPESVAEFARAAELADRHYRLGAVPITTYVELQRQYLDAVDGLLDTKREALDAGQVVEELTGLDIHLIRTVADSPKAASVAARPAVAP